MCFLDIQLLEKLVNFICVYLCICYKSGFSISFAISDWRFFLLRGILIIWCSYFILLPLVIHLASTVAGGSIEPTSHPTSPCLLIVYYSVVVICTYLLKKKKTRHTLSILFILTLDIDTRIVFFLCEHMERYI